MKCPRTMLLLPSPLRPRRTQPSRPLSYMPCSVSPLLLRRMRFIRCTPACLFLSAFDIRSTASFISLLHLSCCRPTNCFPAAPSPTLSRTAPLLLYLTPRQRFLTKARITPSHPLNAHSRFCQASFLPSQAKAPLASFHPQNYLVALSLSLLSNSSRPLLSLSLAFPCEDEPRPVPQVPLDARRVRLGAYSSRL